jgi:hypothetical protein
MRLLPGLAVLLCMMAVSRAAFADSGHERTQFGRDIVVGPNEEVGNATCFGCTIRVRGRITGDAVTFGGNIVVEDNGQIAGDATMFGGGLRLGKGVAVNGDVTVFGGRIRRDPAATVHGDVTVFGRIWLFLIFGLPLVLLGAFVALIVWLVRRLLRPAVPAAA